MPTGDFLFLKQKTQVYENDRFGEIRTRLFDNFHSFYPVVRSYIFLKGKEKLRFLNLYVVQQKEPRGPPVARSPRFDE